MASLTETYAASVPQTSSAPKQFDAQGIIAAYKAMNDQANAVNKRRYGSILTGLKNTRGNVRDLYGQATEQIKGVGKAGAKRINMGEKQDKASADQDLITRGLGNTSIRSSVRRGIGADAERSHQELGERVGLMRSGLLERRAGAEQGLGGMIADFKNSRTDQGPDMGIMAQLLSQAAQGNAGTMQQPSGGMGINATSGLTGAGTPFGTFAGGATSTHSQASAGAAAGLVESIFGGGGGGGPMGSFGGGMGGGGPGAPGMPQATSGTAPMPSGGPGMGAAPGGNPGAPGGFQPGTMPAPVAPGSQAITIYGPNGETRAINIAPGDTPLKAMEFGRIPWGWSISPKGGPGLGTGGGMSMGRYPTGG